jgi:lipopolysaccharide biosynthesis glycosyltransferase
MVFSLCKHCSQRIAVYLLNSSLLKKDIEKMGNYIKNICKAEFYSINVESTLFDEFPTNKQWSKEMYYRILAQFLLPKTLDRILWLDSDIVVLKDISPFYYQDFKGKCIVACREAHDKKLVFSKHKADLGLAKEIYFNSGVILFNLNKIREETNIKMIADLSKSLKDKLVAPDQDILNCLYKGKILYADPDIYNCQNFTQINPNKKNDIVIFHYSGVVKPWKVRYINKSSQYYWKVRCQQGFWGEMLLSYILSIPVQSVIGMWHLLKKCGWINEKKNLSGKNHFDK